MTSNDVINLYTQLENQGIRIWIDGGWAVDALLDKQTRPHKDLDIAVEWKDVPLLSEILRSQNYKQIKEETRWNFVLADDQGREIDIHAFVLGDEGDVVDGVKYPVTSLTGNGTIGGQPVRCISARHMVEFLAPWISKWPEKYVLAVSALCERFGLELPSEYIDFKQRGKPSFDSFNTR